jgi:hypothetical protein
MCDGQEQQEIDNYIARIDEIWRDAETQKAKAKEPILDLASFLQSKGSRPEDI